MLRIRFHRQWNAATGRLWVSPETKAIWGVGLGAFPDSLAAWLATVVHPNDRVRVRQVVQRAAAGRSLEQAQYRIARPDGEVRWVEAFGQSYAPAPGDPLYGARGVVIDITERKRTEDALREREAQLQAILDHTQAVFYLKDLAGRYLLVNRRWEQLTHWTLDAVRGRTDDAVFPQEAAAQFRANDRQALEQGGPYELEEEVSLEGEFNLRCQVAPPVRWPTPLTTSPWPGESCPRTFASGCVHNPTGLGARALHWTR